MHERTTEILLTMSTFDITNFLNITHLKQKPS